jgi:putative ABC transport system permease protein
VRAELREIDPQVPLADVRMMSDVLSRAMAPTRFALVLIGAFAVIAMLLAAVGLYGVLSFAVRQRTAEIGVRVAFGAPRGRIVRLVVGQGIALGAAGVVIGLVASLALTRLITSLLVGVAPTDPLTYGGIALLFMAVAAFASWIPAHRAAGLDPARALREE